MAGWNGSGTFTRTHNWQQDQANGILIRADRHDANDTDFVNGINNCITKDGQNAATADLPMATNKHTGVGNATARDQYLTMGQAQDESGKYYATTGSANAYVLSPVPAITSYTAGQSFKIVPNFANTGAATINISSVGAVALTKNGTTALESGDLDTSTIYTITYDGTQFQIENSALTGDFTNIDVSGNATIGGTLDVTGAATLSDATITDGSTYNVRIIGSDFVVQSTNGGDILQITDAGAASETDANPQLEWNYSATLGGSVTRLGYMGYGSAASNTLNINNDATNGNVQIDTNGTGFLDVNCNTDIAGTLSVDDTLSVVASSGNALMNITGTLAGDDAILDFDVNQSPFRFRANDGVSGNLEITANGGGGRAIAIDYATADVTIDNDLDVTGGISAASVSISGTPIADSLISAWCKFDGTGTDPITIDDGNNVTNVTKNGTGDYTINFASTYANANYAAIAMGAPNTMASYTATAPTTSAVRIQFKTDDGGLTDGANISVIVIGGN